MPPGRGGGRAAKMGRGRTVKHSFTANRAAKPQENITSTVNVSFCDKELNENDTAFESCHNQDGSKPAG
ncbi:hypothetical protein BH10ACI2_BH10ACI2_16060 [soil metagenome]